MDHEDERFDTDDTAPPPKERFIGCLLGMAIGDALGVPGAGLTALEVRRRYGRISSYVPRLDADGCEVVAAGQVGPPTELALCLVESLVSSNGFVDPMTAGYRFAQLLDGEHGHLLSPATRRALEYARDSGDYQAGLADDEAVSSDVAARVVPIGLVHALGRLNVELFVREVLRATLITHAQPEAVNGALAVAYAVDRLTRREVPPEMLISEVLAFIDEDQVAWRLRQAEALLSARSGPTDDGDALDQLGAGQGVASSVAAALYLVAAHAGDYSGAALAAANAGGASAAIGSIAGALCGTWVGGRALPESLVEGLESRMYILMAAPALFRTAQRRAGLFLQLHQR